MSLLKKSRVLLCLLLFQTALVAESGFNNPKSNPYVSADGSVELTWNPLKGSEFQVRRFSGELMEDPILVYEGSDTATTVTGLSEGQYQFQVRARSESENYPDWGNEALVVSVEYIDSRLVVGLLSAGFITFLAIVVAIYTGQRRNASNVVE